MQYSIKTYTKTAQTGVKICASAMIAVSATAMFLTWGMLAIAGMFFIQTLTIQVHRDLQLIGVIVEPAGGLANEITQAKAFEILKSVSDFYKENSYGFVNFIGGNGDFTINDIYPSTGSYRLSLPYRCTSDYNTLCDPSNPSACLGKGSCAYSCSAVDILKEIVPIADNDIVFSNKARVVFFYPKGALCSGDGESVSGALIQTNDSSEKLMINASRISQHAKFVIAHEVGHSFGWGEASFRACENTSMEVEQCPFLGYDHIYDVMGNIGFFHSSAPYKEFSGWLGDAPDAKHRIVTINSENENQVFNLSPLESQIGGIQALKIPHNTIESKSSYLYIEYRQPIGFDEQIIPRLLQYSGGAYNESDIDIFQGALLSVFREGSAENYLIDPTPPPKNYQSALLYNSTYIDPNTNTQISVGTPDNQGLLPVSVKLGRKDFTGPGNISATVISQPDDCTAVVQINATDESGISKVSVYKKNANRVIDEIDLITEMQSPPYQFTYRITQGNNDISIQVEDNAKNQGGLVSNNINTLINIPLPLDYTKCLSDEPVKIVISSPYLSEPISTETMTPTISNDGLTFTYRYDKVLPMQGALDLEVTLYEKNSNSIFSSYSLSLDWWECKEGVCGGCGTSRLCVLFFGEIDSGQQIHLYKNLTNFIQRPHLLEINANTPVNRHTTSFEAYIDLLPPINFKRANTDGDGTLLISDAIRILDYLFIGNIKRLNCKDAADANDDGIVNISDATYILNYLFSGTTPTIPEPFNTIGADPTEDQIGCVQYP